MACLKELFFYHLSNMGHFCKFIAIDKNAMVCSKISWQPFTKTQHWHTEVFILFFNAIFSVDNQITCLQIDLNWHKCRGLFPNILTTLHKRLKSSKISAQKMFLLEKVFIVFSDTIFSCAQSVDTQISWAKFAN